MNSPKKDNLEIKESVDYFITFTLHPIQYTKIPYDQFLDTQSMLINILYTDFHAIKLTLVTELTKTMNIHYHGIMTVNLYKYKGLVINKFFNYFRNLRNARYCKKKEVGKYHVFGFTDIQQIKDDKLVKNYILKNIHETYALLKVYPLIRDDYEIGDKMTFYSRHSEWKKTCLQQYNDAEEELLKSNY